jgi:hypothetical protein
MTMVFVIETPEKCRFCYKPVRGYIYEHQCRPNIQMPSCLSCLIERGICRYCHESFTILKMANETWNRRFYDENILQRKIPSEIIVRVDIDEIVYNKQLGVRSLDFLWEEEPEPPRSKIWDRKLPSSEFRGYTINGEEDEGTEENKDEDKDEHIGENKDEDKEEELCSDEEDEILLSMIDFIGKKTKNDISESTDIPLVEVKEFGKFSIKTTNLTKT